VRRSRLPSIEERTFAFALALIRAYRAVPPRDDAERVIWRQLLKSGTSSGANSAEGPGTQSRREWLTRRHIALKEMRETQFWLRLLRDSGTPHADSRLEKLLDESGQIVAILTATLKTARKNDAANGPGKGCPD
jgi:four helix bundle protein